jgi:hypothetical protein
MTKTAPTVPFEPSFQALHLTIPITLLQHGSSLPALVGLAPDPTFPLGFKHLAFNTLNDT